MHNLIKQALTLVAGAAFGVAMVVIFFLALGLISDAYAHEGVVPVRVANPLEGDRSFNYDPQMNSVVVYVTEVESVTEVRTRYCDQWNRDLKAKVAFIASRIAAKPHLGHLYEDTLKQIHTMWCVA
jgi:hypothetical protein